MYQGTDVSEFLRSHIHMTREDFDIVTENGKHLGATNEFNRQQFQTMMKGELWRYSRRELANVLSVSGDEQFNSTILMLKMMESEVLQLLHSIEHHVTFTADHQRQSAGHPSLPPRSGSGGAGGGGLEGEGGDVLGGRGAVRGEGRAEVERLGEVLRKLEGLGEVSRKLSTSMDRMSERMDGMSDKIDRMPVMLEHQIMRRLVKRLKASSAIRHDDGTVVEADIVSTPSSSEAPKSEWTQTQLSSNAYQSGSPTTHAAVPRVLPLSRRSERREGGRDNGVDRADNEQTHSRSESLARHQVPPPPPPLSLWTGVPVITHSLTLSTHFLTLLRTVRSHCLTHCCTQSEITHQHTHSLSLLHTVCKYTGSRQPIGLGRGTLSRFA